MSRLILACDPGITGAFALLTAAGEVLHVDDLPIIRDQGTAWVDAELLSSALFQHIAGRECTAVVERVHAMPNNGCVAAFSQGSTLCSLLATLQIVRARIELISSATWKTQLGLKFPKGTTDGERKEGSRQRARLLFPGAADRLERKKDHNRGEALLLGHWYLSRAQRAAA
jgi:hypothetical protein